MKKIFVLLLIAIFTVTTFSVSCADSKTRGKKHVSGYHRKNGKYVKPHKANRYYNSSHKHKRKHK